MAHRGCPVWAYARQQSRRSIHDVSEGELMKADHSDALPDRDPGAHLPTRYRPEVSPWSCCTGVIALPWAESLPYELLERVRAALLRA